MRSSGYLIEFGFNARCAVRPFVRSREVSIDRSIDRSNIVDAFIFLLRLPRAERARWRERATFDGCSLDTTRYEYSGDRDKRIEWAERDETMDRRSTSRNTIASASRRIVCLASISTPSSRFLSSRVLSSSVDHLGDPPRRLASLSLSLSLSLSPLSPSPRRRRGGILVINLAKVTLITLEFYLSLVSRQPNPARSLVFRPLYRGEGKTREGKAGTRSHRRENEKREHQRKRSEDETRREIDDPREEKSARARAPSSSYR